MHPDPAADLAGRQDKDDTGHEDDEQRVVVEIKHVLAANVVATAAERARPVPSLIQVKARPLGRRRGRKARRPSSCAAGLDSKHQFPVDTSGVLGDHFDRQRRPHRGFETAQIRGQVLGEGDGLRGSGEFAAQLVLDSELVVRVEEEAHGTSASVGGNISASGGPALILVKRASAGDAGASLLRLAAGWREYTTGLSIPSDKNNSIYKNYDLRYRSTQPVPP